MDFRFSDEHESLRADVRAFLRQNLPDDYIPAHTGSQEQWDHQLAFVRKLAARNWVAPAWPEQYGGLAWSHIQQTIFAEEMSFAGAPEGARVFNVGMIGPTLIVHGTEDQKRQHLPRITSGEAVWCQGYSEPGAGSDLAGVQTRAVRDGDDYVVNGQKIWTTGAHHADWCFMVVRTDPDRPKHRGISFLLVDMKTPGVTVQPIVNMAGYHEFNQLFFDDARVPVANRVGEENNGWYVAMTLLDFERSSVASVASNHRLLDLLARTIRGRRERPLNPGARNRLADLWVANETARLLSYRVAWLQEQGVVPNYEASVIKVLATELGQRIANFGVNLLGLEATLEPDSPRTFARGILEKGYLNLVAPTIYSGSSEIQRNIIATRGLGLPRD